MNETLREAWLGLNATKRFAVVAAVTVGLGLVIYYVLANRTPEYKPLFVHIDPREASAVTQKLHELKVPYQLTNEGETILVPAAQLYQTRLEMASAGLLSKGTAGFDLFDKVRLQTSALSERVLYQRALQGELSSTIASIEEVESVRVHLVLPRQEIFVDDQKPTSASVVLKLRAGKRLTRKQVDAIKALVTCSVENVKPENVSVMDTHGEMLSRSSGDELGAGGGGTTLLELQRSQESNIEQRVEQLLERILGPGQAVVRAAVQLDTEQKSVEADQYVPTDKNAGIVRSMQTTDELYKGAAAAPAPAAAPSAAPSGAPRPAAVAANANASNYNHRVTTTNYEISRKQEKITQHAGGLKHVSVAVALSQKVKLTPEQLADLEKLVGEAAGLDKARNDSLHISYVAFYEPDTATEDEAMKAELRERRWYEWARLGIPLVSVLLFWFMAGRIMRRVTRPVPARHVNVRLTEQRPEESAPSTRIELPVTPPPAALQAPKAAAPAAALAEKEIDPWDEMRAGLEAALPHLSNSATSEAAEEARRAALDKPAATVQLLEKWVNAMGDKK